MGEAITDQLRALVARWEAEAASSDGDEYSDRSDAYRDCASALRALIGLGVVNDQSFQEPT